MKHSFNFVAAALFAVAGVLNVPSDGIAQTAPHVRILDGRLKTRLESGLSRSPTLRTLVDQIQSAPVLVFVNCDVRMPARIGARLNLIASVNGMRYVRVDIDCRLGARLQFALLAHELQHAVEVGGRPDILDNGSMQSYYEEFGFQSHSDGYHTSYETQAAIDIQAQVMMETARVSSDY